MPFLERLSQHLQGKPLELPSLDVWWLGESSALAFALANLDLMIVRPCLGADREPIIVGMLEPADRKALEERIRAQPEWNGTKIIMLTARGREVERERGLSLGADAYVTKPFSTRELVDQVKRMLDVP